MHSCSTPNVPPVITCHLPNCCTLLGKALDEVAPRWELALQTQGRDGKVVGDLIVAESPRFCMRHRRQAQLTRHSLPIHEGREVADPPFALLWLMDRYGDRAWEIYTCGREADVPTDAICTHVTPGFCFIFSTQTLAGWMDSFWDNYSDDPCEKEVYLIVLHVYL